MLQLMEGAEPGRSLKLNRYVESLHLEASSLPEVLLQTGADRKRGTIACGAMSSREGVKGSDSAPEGKPHEEIVAEDRANRIANGQTPQAGDDERIEHSYGASSVLGRPSAASKTPAVGLRHDGPSPERSGAERRAIEARVPCPSAGSTPNDSETRKAAKDTADPQTPGCGMLPRSQVTGGDSERCSTYREGCESGSGHDLPPACVPPPKAGSVEKIDSVAPPPEQRQGSGTGVFDEEHGAEGLLGPQDEGKPVRAESVLDGDFAGDEGGGWRARRGPTHAEDRGSCNERSPLRTWGRPCPGLNPIRHDPTGLRARPRTFADIH